MRWGPRATRWKRLHRCIEYVECAGLDALNAYAFKMHSKYVQNAFGMRSDEFGKCVGMRRMRCRHPAILSAHVS